jgi:hypothetical protein
MGRTSSSSFREKAMKKGTNTTLYYSLLALISILVALLGYVYTHKPFNAENLIGILTALWQAIIATIILAIAGGIGEHFLRLENGDKLARLGLDLALGMPILSITTLIIGMIIGVGFLPLALLLGFLLVLFRKPIINWLRLFSALKPTQLGKYTMAIALMAALFFVMHFAISLAPPSRYDALVYHFSLPKAYLHVGQIQYLPDNMFWGMPQNSEMLYLLAMRFAGAESAALISFLVGLIALLGISGFVNERFGKIAAWTAAAAFLAGESFTVSLSSGYVEWEVILFGWAALVSLDYWYEARDRKMLVLCGILCGAAIGTKYTAGIILLGSLATLAFLPTKQNLRQRLANIFIVGSLAVLLSLPWWFKNFIATNNPFYPFFFSAGAMNEFRLFHYQEVPTWGDWKSVILLPWQATIWGAESKDGFSASLGAIFVGLSPLFWIGWSSRTERQKNSIKVAIIPLLVGFLLWGISSRFSGLLIQSRLFFGIFPAWALLTGAGMDSTWKLRAMNIRFGRVAAALVLLMLGFNLFATWTEFIFRNPAAYIVRQENQQRYLTRNLGVYSKAMESINALSPDSHVLLLWEARGYPCWPKCDADEVIDRWYNDVNVYQSPEVIMQTWIDQSYTHLLLFQAGAEFIRERDPRYSIEQWQKLDDLLSRLPPPVVTDTYALYSLRDQ